MSPRNVTAVLGPTNTGKTHLAVERMLGHETGMIGLPLRLLAREIYDQVRVRRGDQAVALITGEEKIVPPEPRYWVCTVEAMPPDIKTDFLAVDEVQLAADFDRGHVFADRMLHRRGTHETMLLGAATMRSLIDRLLPGTNFVTRPRFSKLSYAGQKKITRLPRRCAVVAFSAETVYAIAELIRRQRGGAAVVLGALSPRTRNAQVNLYQSGDVDFLVATDAIGMGLNMDVGHIAFAATRKFDGFSFRTLSPAELGQIAGRAGRYMHDGTFGVTGEAEPFAQEVIDRLENHHFDPVQILQWRNSALEFGSLEALQRSLAAAPRLAGLTRAQPGPDVLALEHLGRDEEIRAIAAIPAAVRLLWEVCQIPDYRNITGAEHANLVGHIYRFLASDRAAIPADWFARQLSYSDRSDGDIDTLATRIAHVRTWTFVANRSDWLEEPLHWRERAQAIEDKLSDALHERLAQRFVDRRTSVLMRRLREKDELLAEIEGDGRIFVEGEFVGALNGFHFVPDTRADDVHGKALRAASVRTIVEELAARARSLAAAADTSLSLDRDGAILWGGARVARLCAGPGLLTPRLSILADETLSGPDRQAVQARVERWIAARIASTLGPLVALAEAANLEGLSRGIAFRLVEKLGVLVRQEVAEEVRALDQAARGLLRRHGVRFGAFHVFIPDLLKPSAVELKLLLWGLELEKAGRFALKDMPAPPGSGLTSVPFDPTTPQGFYRTAGFRVCGNRAVRIDMIERLADLIRVRVFWKPAAAGDVRPAGSVEGGGFTPIADMMSLVGCSGEEFAGVLRALDFRCERRPAPVSSAAAAAEQAAGEPVPAPPRGDAAAAHAAAPDTLLTPGEPCSFEVWWPKETGPFRSVREERAKPRRRGRPPGKAIEARPRKSSEPLPSEDSPFAVLGILKARMAASGRKGSAGS